MYKILIDTITWTYEFSIILYENSNKNCNSKQAKKVNRILKNVDKDLARIKERELSRSLSPEGKQFLNGVNDTNTVSLNLTSSPTSLG